MCENVSLWIVMCDSEEEAGMWQGGVQVQGGVRLECSRRRSLHVILLSRKERNQSQSVQLKIKTMALHSTDCYIFTHKSVLSSTSSASCMATSCASVPPVFELPRACPRNLTATTHGPAHCITSRHAAEGSAIERIRLVYPE